MVFSRCYFGSRTAAACWISGAPTGAPAGNQEVAANRRGTRAVIACSRGIARPLDLSGVHLGLRLFLCHPVVVWQGFMLEGLMLCRTLRLITVNQPPVVPVDRRPRAWCQASRRA